MSSRFTKNATITFIMNPTPPPQFHVTKMLLKTPDLSSARNETIVRMELPNCRLTIFVNEAFTPLKAISKLRLRTVVRDSGWLSTRDAASHWGKPEQAVKLMSLLHLTSGKLWTRVSKTQHIMYFLDQMLPLNNYHPWVVTHSLTKGQTQPTKW